MILKIVLGTAVLILLGITMVQDVTLANQSMLIRAMMKSPGCMGAPVPKHYEQITPDPKVPREQ